MPLFERPPLETLAPAKDRWTPLYLEHGRLEVDDSSVKWIAADGLLCRIPVATVSALILGPGTTVTHAAIKACAESNPPVCWTGEESLRFYAFGLTPNHTNAMPPLHAEAWADTIKVVTDRFKENGARQIVLASPGCVDSNFFALSQTAPFDRTAMEATQKNLSMLRDSARKLATREGLIFADMHTPMVEVMAKAQTRYGKDYAFAGGRGDGVHPGSAGHLVMAWVYLKAMGYDGTIGTVTVLLDKGSAQASEGHKVLSVKDGVVALESTRSPFCFLGDRKNPKNDATGDSTRSVIDLFPFNDDLNRLTLMVRGAKAKRLKVTWDGHAKELDSAALEKGVNLAAEFLDNPFCEPFAKCLAALRERNACLSWLKQDAYKNNPSIPKRLAAALKALEPSVVRHTIKVEQVP